MLRHAHNVVGAVGVPDEDERFCFITLALILFRDLVGQ